MKKNNTMHCLVYRIRKSGGVRISIRDRTVYFDYNNPILIEEKKVKRLMKEFNYAAQAEIKQ